MNDDLAQHRILFVLPSFELGGAERQAVLLAAWLKRHTPAEVAVAAFFGGTGPQAVRALCESAGLPCLRFNMPRMHGELPTHAALRHIARELRFLRPSVLLPYLSFCNVACGLTWQIAGARTCIWNQRDLGIGLPDGPAQRRAAVLTPAFIANAPAAATCLTQRLGVDPARIRIIPNGIALAPPRVSRADWRRAAGIADERIVTTMVANIQPHKDHATLLRAWAEVCAGHPAGHRPLLLLAGQRAAGASPLEPVIEAAGIADAVRLLGPVDDVSSLLYACDLAVLSSPTEGLPNAVLEAMAAGLPVAATDNEGARAALGEAAGGLLAPAGDAATLAAILQRLIADGGLRRQLGADNKRRADAEFSVARLGTRSVDAIVHGLEAGRSSTT